MWNLKEHTSWWWSLHSLGRLGLGEVSGISQSQFDSLNLGNELSFNVLEKLSLLTSEDLFFLKGGSFACQSGTQLGLTSLIESLGFLTFSKMLGSGIVGSGGFVHLSLSQDHLVTAVMMLMVIQMVQMAVCLKVLIAARVRVVVTGTTSILVHHGMMIEVRGGCVFLSGCQAVLARSLTASRRLHD